MQQLFFNGFFQEVNKSIQSGSRIAFYVFNATVVKSLDGPRGYTYVQKQRLGIVYFLVTHFSSSEWSLLQSLRKIIWHVEHWQLWCDAGLLQVMRTEILLVLVADCAIFAIYPDTIASVGYAIVLACSFGLILAPKIEDKLCPTKASIPNEISGPPKENEAYVKEAWTFNVTQNLLAWY